MKCSQCDNENVEGLLRCSSCGRQLKTTTGPATTVTVRLSRLAIASFIFALCGLACSVPAIVAEADPAVLNPRSDLAVFSRAAAILGPGAAFCLGVAALAEIGFGGGRRTGYGLAAIGAVIPAIQLFGFCCLPPSRWGHSRLPRMTCGVNLSGIGKAMLIYANDYDDTLPVAGGPNGRWVARLPWWAAENLTDAYGLGDPNATDGRGSISASLYLLVKYAEVTPKSFVCEADYGTTEFKPSKYGLASKNLTDIWDFGPDPPLHCSYSYHVPYGPHPLTMYSEPGMAIAADRNPWIDSPFAKARDFSLFKPDIDPWNGTAEQACAGNAVAHHGDGQNVLFLDSHVQFIRRPYVSGSVSFSARQKSQQFAEDEENVYTYWNGEDRVRGTPPVLGSQPANRHDSLLVNDPAIPR